MCCHAVSIRNKKLRCPRAARRWQRIRVMYRFETVTTREQRTSETGTQSNTGGYQDSANYDTSSWVSDFAHCLNVR